MATARALCKIVIAVFCMWHMAAVGIYSLYTVEGYPVLEWLESKRDTIKPYVLITSQWQRWNLFSPDPLRRVIEMRIEQLVESQWEEAWAMHPKNVSYWQRAPELKILRRMEGEDNTALQDVYVKRICKQKGIPVGTSVRLTKRWYVIPKHDKTHSTAWWNAWKPVWNETVLIETLC